MPLWKHTKNTTGMNKNDVAGSLQTTAPSVRANNTIVSNISGPALA